MKTFDSTYLSGDQITGTPVQPVGIHLVVDAWQSPATLLNDPLHIKQALTDAVQAGGATLIDLCVHQFSPYGVTATATLAESHIAIHTWPEYGYFAADLFFCGKGDPYQAMRSIQTTLQAKQIKVTEIKRGWANQRSLPIFAHEHT
jgi:S-adenosylmethionine decarboxylase